MRTTHPERSRMTLPLSANITGKLWIQSRTLSFGVFEPGTGKTASLKFGPGKPNVTMRNVRARARMGKLRVEVKPDPLHKDRGLWRLYGHVPTHAPSGTLDDEVIELHTGVEGEDLVLIKVRGRIREPLRDR